MKIQLLENIKQYIVDPVILLLFGLALIIFLYGLVEFLWKGDTGKDYKEGRDKIVWGLVGMAIMTSVYGFLNIIVSTIDQLMTGM